MLNWVFRSRQDGTITIGQVPNVPLAVFLILTVMRWIVRPVGAAGTAFSVVATGALTIWALDELVRGVNPWRRTLGAVTLAWQALRLIAR